MIVGLVLGAALALAPTAGATIPCDSWVEGLTLTAVAITVDGLRQDAGPEALAALADAGLGQPSTASAELTARPTFPRAWSASCTAVVNGQLQVTFDDASTGKPFTTLFQVEP